MNVNTCLRNLGLMQFGRLFIDERLDIWLLQDSRPSPRIQRICSLSTWLQAENYKKWGDDFIVKANGLVNHVAEMQFCLCKLIPYLAFLDSGEESESGQHRPRVRLRRRRHVGRMRGSGKVTPIACPGPPTKPRTPRTALTTAAK